MISDFDIISFLCLLIKKIVLMKANAIKLIQIIAGNRIVPNILSSIDFLIKVFIIESLFKSFLIKKLYCSC